MIEGLIRTYLRGISAQRILDVGPGYAGFSRVAAAVTGAREITFVDVDTRVLEWQAEQSRAEGIRPIPVRAHLSQSGVSVVQGYFDVIHCQEVLEHLEEAPLVLRALAGHLTPEGRILITVPTRVSERWLRFLNPGYMEDEPYGHINQYDRRALLDLVHQAGLTPCVVIPAQPHFFIAHTWFYGTRMRSEASTGAILTRGLRGFVFSWLLRATRFFFVHTAPGFWGALFPRNYFVVAKTGATGQAGEPHPG